MKALSITRRAFKFWILALVFLIWNQKRKIRSLVKYSSFGLISVPTLLLFGEVLLEKQHSGLVERAAQI